MKKWLEDAQPEWPEVASDTGRVPATGGNTQTFPETGENGVQGGASPADRTDEPRIPAPRDPWDDASHEPGGHVHDPDEVTIQLDDPDRGLDDPKPAARGGPGGGPDASDGPVFVDESGRRSRRLRRIGITVGGTGAVYAVVIVATLLSGNSDAPWLPVPGQQDEQPAVQVETSPLPAQTAARPGGTGTAAPGTTPIPGAGPEPAPGASASGPTASGPAASASPDKPDTSADPEPSATRTTGTTLDPGTSGTPGPGPSGPIVTDPPEPTSSNGVDPSPGPSLSPPPAAPGSADTVADGPADTTPVTQEPGAA